MRLAYLLVAVATLLAVACSGDKPPLTCTSNDDCHEFYTCDVNDTKACLRACADDTECLAGQYCDVANEVCREDDRVGGGDPGAGDPGAGDPGAGDPGAGDPAGD